MMPPSKRPHDFIDLTDDSPVRAKPKKPRTTASSNQVYSGSSTAQTSQSTQGSQRAAYSPSSSSRVLPNKQSRTPASQQRDLFDDEPELIDLTQADDGPIFEFYGTIDHKIVGVRYYNGIVSPGEVVILRREPNNQ